MLYFAALVFVFVVVGVVVNVLIPARAVLQMLKFRVCS